MVKMLNRFRCRRGLFACWPQKAILEKGNAGAGVRDENVKKQSRPTEDRTPLSHKTSSKCRNLLSNSRSVPAVWPHFSAQQIAMLLLLQRQVVLDHSVILLRSKTPNAAEPLG